MEEKDLKYQQPGSIRNNYWQNPDIANVYNKSALEREISRDHVRQKRLAKYDNKNS